jgi:hypothetical protein
VYDSDFSASLPTPLIVHLIILAILVSENVPCGLDLRFPDDQ